MRRLAFAFALSVGAHAALLAQTAIAPGIAEASLLAPHGPLRARLEPAPVRAADDGAELLSPRSETVPPPPYVIDPPHAARGEVVAQAAGLPGPEIYYDRNELDERAEPLNQVDLVYPEAALAAGTAGTVRIRIRIDHGGALREASVIGSEPAGLFDKAALDAVQQLKFKPATRRGVAVGSVKTIEIPFHPNCKHTGSCIE